MCLVCAISCPLNSKCNYFLSILPPVSSQAPPTWCQMQWGNTQGTRLPLRVNTDSKLLYHSQYPVPSVWNLHVTPEISANFDLIGSTTGIHSPVCQLTHTCIYILKLQGIHVIFFSHEHGVTLGCVAVSSLEAAALLLARVGSETGAATFLDLYSGKTPTSLSSG